MSQDRPRQGPPGVAVTPDDVGERVSVRRLLGVRGGRPVYGDVLGILESWQDGRLTVVRRDGERVEIEEGVLVAGKTVPPAPTRRGGGAGRADGRPDRQAPRP